MVQKKHPPILSLALLLAVAAPASLVVLPNDSSVAQTAAEPTEFPLPTAVPSDTTVRIDGSSSMTVINESLKQRFEQQYDAAIDLATNGTDSALQALLDGDIDLAAIGRPLTDEERAQGIVDVPINREKIAIIVGAENPFTGNLTFEQFARIFRGEITDWSEVGGTPGPIRFVDRPDTSDTRTALGNYEVFKVAPFENGSTTTQVADDDTDAVVAELGSDGISYAIASQVLERDDVTILPMHNTLPDDPRYPYSQPRGYAYTNATSPAVIAFLGFATAPPGQEAVQAALAEEAAAVAAGGAASDTAAETATADTDAAAVDPATADTESATVTEDADADAAVSAVPAGEAESQAAPPWLWWLLPLLALLGLLGWWWKRRSATPGAVPPAVPPTGAASLPPDVGAAPGAAPPADPTLASRANSVVTSDRSTLGAGRSAVPPEAPNLPPVPSADPPAAPVAESPDLNLGAIGTAAAAAAAAAAGAGLVTGADTDEAPVADPPEPETIPPAEPVAEVVELPEPEVVPPVAPLVDEAAAIDEPAVAVPPVEAAIAPEPEIDTEVSVDPVVADVEPVEPIAPVEPVVEPAAPVTDTPGLTPPLVAGAAALGAGAILAAMSDDHSQSDVEAAKFDVGQTDLSSEQLADVDSGLAELPDGYGESRVVLMPRDPQWAYAYWDVPNEHREALRRQGGMRLALRLYDVTDVDMATQNPHTVQQYDCEEFARDWYVPVPVSDRDYVAEIGYLTADGTWLILARSAPAHIPPVYPSDWYDEQFLTIGWEEDLRGKTFLELVPSKKKTAINNAIYTALFGMAQSSESMRVAGSLFGSMHQVPQQAISSFVFPSGAGLWAMPTGPIPTLSGVGMSGVGMMSGVGFAASMPPIRPRKFWLVADAELIVYGATEPDATVTIANRPVQLSPDGTFRFQMSFQDGILDFPIRAVAVDGEQTRSIQMTFNRETPERNTNTKDEATEDWFS